MRIRRSFILLLPLMSLVFLSTVYAADGGRLLLSASDTSLEEGQEITVDVLVEDAPTIYGVDVQLTFDPALLEVVDADESTPEIQLQLGDFIDASQSFFLQHGADNEKGTVDYALALLNPAPPEQGDGLLVRVTFRAKAEGQTTITITEGLYGTQTGETIAPTLDSVEINVAAEGAANPADNPMGQLLGYSNTSQGQGIPGFVILGIVLASVLIGLVLLFVWQRRKRKQSESVE